MTSTFSPDAFLTSMFDSLTDYILSVTNTDLHEVVMDFESAAAKAREMDFQKVIIHLEIDDVDTERLGFGEGFTNQTVVEPTDLVAGTVTMEQGLRHTVNFDVGIWATKRAGGVTARLRAYQLLSKTFNGEIARQRCLAFTEGVEIMFFNSGRFIQERIDDVTVFRAVGAELQVRVYGRDVADAVVIADQDPEVDASLVITDDTGTGVPVVG